MTTPPNLPPLPAPAAYLTEHDDHPRLWLDVLEARMYVECGEEPQALVLASEVAAIRLADRKAMVEWAASQIPTNWLDSLLSGPDAVLGPPPWHCPDIERLLAALRSSLNAAESTAGVSVGAAPSDEQIDAAILNCFALHGLIKNPEALVKAGRALLGTPGVKACGSYECKAAQQDGVLCADGECDRVNGVRPAGVALPLKEQQ